MLIHHVQIVSSNHHLMFHPLSDEQAGMESAALLGQYNPKKVKGTQRAGFGMPNLSTETLWGIHFLPRLRTRSGKQDFWEPRRFATSWCFTDCLPHLQLNDLELLVDTQSLTSWIFHIELYIQNQDLQSELSKWSCISFSQAKGHESSVSSAQKETAGANESGGEATPTESLNESQLIWKIWLLIHWKHGGTCIMEWLAAESQQSSELCLVLEEMG